MASPIDKGVASRVKRSFLIRIPKVLLIFLLVAAVLVALYHFTAAPIQRLLYPIQYREAVEDAAAEYGLPPSLIFAVIYTESKWDADAVSSAGAMGLMQITDETYQWARRRAGEDAGDANRLFEPQHNIHYGAAILSLLFENFSDTATVLAAYNAGQGHVRLWLADPAYSADGITLFAIPFEETENYVHRVLHIQQLYQSLYSIP